jgi:hypothetical protein
MAGGPAMGARVGMAGCVLCNGLLVGSPLGTDENRVYGMGESVGPHIVLVNTP